MRSRRAAVGGPVIARRDRIAHYERTERSTDAGLHPELGEAEDRLIATLAHELRNPLASIMTALFTLRDRRADEPMAGRALDIAERQARHMVRIIEDVLDLCRAGRGKLSLRKERVDLATVVAGAIETADTLLATRGHHLTVSLPPGPVSLVADPSCLNQILTNLLTNAAKYTDPGGEIGLAAEVAAGEVVLQVRDNGMGIAPDLLPRVFDLFQQGDGPGDQACGGLGIGLALVKSLVELHGGSVSAFSGGPGTGSQFAVRLLDCAPNVQEGRAPCRPENGASLVVTSRDLYRASSVTESDGGRVPEVRARVPGYLDEVKFKDGDEVKEGALLFEIDPRLYQDSECNGKSILDLTTLAAECGTPLDLEARGPDAVAAVEAPAVVVAARFYENETEHTS